MGARGQVWPSSRCTTEVEARDPEQAAENHDLWETHPFEDALPEVDSPEGQVDLDEFPELFRVVTDGTGRLLAVDDEGRVYARVALDEGLLRTGGEQFAHLTALLRLVALAASELVDPTE